MAASSTSSKQRMRAMPRLRLMDPPTAARMVSDWRREIILFPEKIAETTAAATTTTPTKAAMPAAAKVAIKLGKIRIPLR